MNMGDSIRIRLLVGTGDPIFCLPYSAVPPLTFESLGITWAIVFLALTDVP